MTTVATYEVDVEYVGKDKGAQGAADKLGLSIGQLQGHLGSVRGGLDTVIGGMERLALGAAALGVGVGAAGIRMLVGQMIDLNGAAEDTRIAVAGMLGANGATGNWGESMEIAQTAMQQIRRDAAALPGEAEDYVNIFRSGLAPMLQSGLDVSGAVRMADRFGAVTSMLGVDSQQAGRDLNLMLQGHAGAQVRSWGALQAQIGKTAHEFNALGAEQRRVLLDHALGRYDDAIAAAGRSWNGIRGTIVSAGKEFLRMAGEPLFDRMKQRAQGFVEYLGNPANAAQMAQTAESWGRTVAHWFDVAWGRAREGVAWFRANWRELRAEFMNDLQNAGRLYVGLRAGSAGLGAIQGGLSIANSAHGLGLGAGAGEAAAGAAGAVGVAELGVVAAGAALSVGAMAYAISSGAFDVKGALSDLREPTEILRGGLTHLWDATSPLIASFGSLGLTLLTDFAYVVGGLVGKLSDFAAILTEFYGELAHYMVTNPLRAVGLMGPEAFGGVGATQPTFHDDLRDSGDIRHVVASRPHDPAGLGRRPTAPHGNTTIHNHFRIEQSDNPERVALTVQHVMERELRNPTQASRPGLTRLG